MLIVRKINPVEAEKIILSRKPLGKFMFRENGRYTAIDNTHGDAWTESFSCMQSCMSWLKGKMDL